MNIVYNHKGNDLNINYTDEGKGSCVLILHGWGTSIEVYRSIIDSLSCFRRVVVFDMPGFGKSDEPKEAFDVKDYAECALFLCKTLGLESVSLIGHSHGGRVAIQLATQCKNDINIEKIILLDSAGVIAKKSLKVRAKIRFYKIGKAVLSFPPVMKLFPDALNKFKNKKGSADYNAASEVMKKSLVKCVNTDMTPFMPHISAPTLLVFGENDTATTVSDAKVMEKLIPDSGLVVIKNAGHYSFLDNPLLFKSVMYSFFDIK